MRLAAVCQENLDPLDLKCHANLRFQQLNKGFRTFHRPALLDQRREYFLRVVLLPEKSFVERLKQLLPELQPKESCRNGGNQAWRGLRRRLPMGPAAG